MMTSKLNGDYTNVLRQNRHIDKRYHKAFKKAHKAGDTGCMTMQNGGSKMMCLQTRFLRSKYNSSAFDYVKNILWDIRTAHLYD